MEQPKGQVYVYLNERKQREQIQEPCLTTFTVLLHDGKLCQYQDKAYHLRAAGNVVSKAERHNQRAYKSHLLRRFLLQEHIRRIQEQGVLYQGENANSRKACYVVALIEHNAVRPLLYHVAVAFLDEMSVLVHIVPVGKYFLARHRNMVKIVVDNGDVSYYQNRRYYHIQTYQKSVISYLLCHYFPHC